MQEIVKEYGPALITVVAIISLVAIVLVLTNSENGVVTTAFKELITNFFTDVKAVGKTATETGL